MWPADDGRPSPRYDRRGLSFQGQPPFFPGLYDWPIGDVGVIVPPNMWWHGHFVTSPNAIQLAVKLRSRFYPINHLFDKSHIPVTQGGKVLRFEDLHDDVKARVWDTFVEECQREGVTALPPDDGSVTA